MEPSTSTKKLKASIAIYGIETMPRYIRYGESSLACERVVQAYCQDKTDPTLDAGCFDWATKSTKLRFSCDEASCFGQGMSLLLLPSQSIGLHHFNKDPLLTTPCLSLS